jgi:hypothetical protein
LFGVRASRTAHPDIMGIASIVTRDAKLFIFL